MKTSTTQAANRSHFSPVVSLGGSNTLSMARGNFVGENLHLFMWNTDSVQDGWKMDALQIFG